MRVKKMSVEEGRTHNLSKYPNLHKSGSVRGMKKLYYGLDALIVRSGDYYYNVTSNPEIYNHATI